jgi:hypothetical protein
VYAAGLLFSTIFLGITLIVYLALPMVSQVDLCIRKVI